MLIRRRAVLSACVVFPGVICALWPAPILASEPRADRHIAWVFTRDGRSLEGVVNGLSLSVTVAGSPRAVKLTEILSVNFANDPSASESDRITNLLAVIGGKDRAISDVAVEEMTEIGLPVMSPLLAAYKDTDAHEPNPFYRL